MLSKCGFHSAIVFASSHGLFYQITCLACTQRKRQRKSLKINLEKLQKEIGIVDPFALKTRENRYWSFIWMKTIKRMFVKYIWWPKTDINIERRIRNCLICMYCLSILKRWHLSISSNIWGGTICRLQRPSNHRRTTVIHHRRGSVQSWIHLELICLITSIKLIFTFSGIQKRIVSDNKSQLINFKFKESLQ